MQPCVPHIAQIESPRGRKVTSHGVRSSLRWRNPPVVSPSLSTRRPSSASKSLAEQFQPIVTIHETLRQRANVELDVDGARERIRGGRPGFDAATLLHSAGDLTRPFHRTAAAFERIGIASTTELAALRHESLDATALMASWANGESMPRNPALRLARSVAASSATRCSHARRGTSETASPSPRGNACSVRAAALRPISRCRPTGVARWSAGAATRCGARRDSAVSAVAPTRRRRLSASRRRTWLRARDLSLVRAVSQGTSRRADPSLIVERALTAALDEAAEKRGLRV